MVGFLALAGCGKEAQQTTMPLPTVVVQYVEVVEHNQSRSYIGRVEAVEDTAITAQVSGYLKQRHFEEGQMVKAGDLLYSIEPSSFKAQLASAKATLAQALASLNKAELDFNRGKELLPRGSISQSEFDTLTSAHLGAKAQVEAAKAQLNLAEVNLSYTEIRAPFDGRISQTSVSTGELVSPSSGVLATLVSLDPVHAAIRISERERLMFGMDKVKGNGHRGVDRVEVQVLLEDNSQYPHLGTLDYLGNRIDLNTGTLAIRAQVPNPEQQLLPGQHIRVELRNSQATEAVVVPRRAVQTDLEGNYVMVVTEGNVAERRNVELGKQLEHGIILTSGISKDDLLIVQGLQRVRNGVPVAIQQPKSVD